MVPETPRPQAVALIWSHVQLPGIALTVVDLFKWLQTQPKLLITPAGSVAYGLVNVLIRQQR